MKGLDVTSSMKDPHSGWAAMNHGLWATSETMMGEARCNAGLRTNEEQQSCEGIKKGYAANITPSSAVVPAGATTTRT
jgi:hypothetical protein